MKQTIIGLIILIVVLGLSVLILGLRDPDDTDPSALEGEETEEEQTRFGRLQNTTIRVPETEIPVALIDGSGSYSDGPVRGFVNLTDLYIENGDALVTVVVVDSGGSGTFYYLVLFEDTGETLVQLDEVFLGDRIGILDMHKHEDQIEVAVLVRAGGEPFVVEPTILETRVFVITRNTLTELTTNE